MVSDLLALLEEAQLDLLNCANIAEQLGEIVDDAQVAIILYPLLFRKDMNSIRGGIDKVFSALWNISRRAEVKILVKEGGGFETEIELVPWKDITTS